MNKLRIRKRVALSVGAILIVSAITAGIAAGTDAVREQRSDIKPVAKTREQLIAELPQLEGPKDTPLLQPTPDPALTASNLRRHGPFRIVPPEFAGELPYDDLATGFDHGPASSDVSVLRDSPLYLDVSPLIPPGFTLEAIDTAGGGINSFVRQVFTDRAGRTIEIGRALVLRDPIDVYVDLHEPGEPDETVYQTEIGYVSSHEALFTKPSTLAKQGDELAKIQFVQDGVLTRVLGLGIDFDTAVRIADGIVKLDGG